MVSCTERSLNSIPTEITANVDPEGVLKLDLSDNPIETIPKESIGLFKNLEELVLTNNGLSVIEDGAFDGLPHLLTLNLSNNQLSDFKSEICKENSVLSYLILSNNTLESWDNFKISDFSNLQYLDISNNKFTYLPVDILEVLETNEKFSLSLDGNPWDCENDIWRNSGVHKILCETQNGDSITADVRIDVDVSTAGSNINNTIGYFNPTTESPATNTCIVKSYRRNLLPIWLALAIVAGIIIGNGDRIYGWLQSKCTRKNTARITSKYLCFKP